MHAVEPSSWHRLGEPPATGRQTKYLPRRDFEQTCGRPINWTDDGILYVVLALVILGARIVWHSTLAWYVLWHLAALMTWRVGRAWWGNRSTPGIQGTARSHTPVTPRASFPRHMLVAATLSIPLPAIAEFVFSTWFGAAQAYSRAYPEYNGLFASIGPFGYWGTWLGAAALHALIVHTVGGGGRGLWWWTVAALSVALLNTPIVLGWTGWLMPMDYAVRCIPY